MIYKIEERDWALMMRTFSGVINICDLDRLSDEKKLKEIKDITWFMREHLKTIEAINLINEKK